MKLSRLIIAAAVAMLAISEAHAVPATYPPVQTYPVPRSGLDNESGTITVTNTFQQVFPANTNRLDCLIQNTSADTQWVFSGAVASATKGTSITLAAGQAYYCAFNGITYQGIVSITGTATDAFYATGK
jgi:hypothetical protein